MPFAFRASRFGSSPTRGRPPERGGLLLALLATLAASRAAVAADAPGAAKPDGTVTVPGLSGQTRCGKLTLEADTMDCDSAHCVLRGEVALACEGLRLWSDALDIAREPDGSYGGAVAVGHVLLVEGLRVVTCSRVVLGADRVQTRMEDADVHVRRQPVTVSGKEAAPGRDQAHFTGERVERLDEKHLHIESGSFTLCDCEGGVPSWVIDAGTINATLGDRVTIWWPTFRVNLLDLGHLVPVLKLPPTSVPLKPRAFGFVRPGIRFFGAGWPTLDFPFFLPLGDSYDLTVIPGLRMDWSTSHHLTPPSSWGAFRLGGRFRYAPVSGTDGTLSVDETNDRKHAAARLLDRKTGIVTDAIANCGGTNLESALAACEAKGETDRANNLRALRDRESLVNRVRINWAHQSTIGSELRFLGVADWVSDDYYPSDFGVGLADQQAPYLPSRAQLQWTRASLAGSLAGDYLQRIGNTPSHVTNLQHGETWMPERGPAARLHLEPLALAAGLHLDADASAIRYGPWAPAPAAASPAVLVGGAAAGIDYLDRVGPVELSARAGIDSLWVNANDRAAAIGSTVALASAEAFVHLARRYGNTLHIVTPMLSYRAIPWRRGEPLADVTFRAGAQAAPPLTPVTMANVEERLRRDERFHQGLVSLDQALWTSAGQRLAGLELGQPFDLEHASLLPSRAALDMHWPGRLDFSAAAGVYFPGAGKEVQWRELSAGFAGHAEPVTVSVGYVRLSPQASRLLRTIYEIEAPPNRTLPGRVWVHFLSPAASVAFPYGLRADYATTYLLPTPDTTPQTTLGFIEHRGALAYRSPCDCWELGATLAWPRGGSPRIGVTLNVAGYAIGM